MPVPLPRRRRPVASRTAGVVLSVVAGLLVPPGPASSAGPISISSTALAIGAGSRPNIVLIVTDDQNPDTVPSDGVEAMPNLEARLDDPSEPWTRFTNAYLNTPLCCPSRATILSGQYSHHTGVGTNSAAANFDEDHTVATWLHDAGYRTALIGKYLNPYPFNRGNYVPPGWDRWVAKAGANTLHYDYTLIEDGTPVTYGSDPEDYQMDVLAGKAVDFIETAPSSQPFFLYFAPQSPHAPYVPAPRHEDVFRTIPDFRTPAVNEADVSDKPAWIRNLPLRTETEMDRLDDHRRKQMEMLLAVDEGVEAIIDALEARGALEDTLVVFMTDNGFAMGEHRWSYKKCVYEVCTRTPFFVRVPGAPRGEEGRLVSNVDLAPTLVELAGAEAVIPGGFDGTSLVPLLLGPPPSTWRDLVLLEWKGERGEGSVAPPFWAVRSEQFLYSELETGEVELYDLAGVIGPADPYELDNRAGQPEYAAVQAQLADRLTELKADGGVPEIQADLSLSLEDSPDPVAVGNTLTYLLGVENAGPDPAEDVTLSQALPGDAAFVGVDGTQGTCAHASATIECDLGSLGPGDEATVTVQVVPEAEGTLATQAGVTSATADPDGSDDGASATTTVIVCTQRGTAGSDVLLGTEGTDVLCGLGGDDTIKGLGADDLLIGGPGSDLLVPGAGDDRVEGGTGLDTASFAGSDAPVTAVVGGEASGQGLDALPGVERLTGSSRADRLTGGAGVNVLRGAAGNDVLTGLGGDDVLWGGAGADHLVGGLGLDVLHGGPGADLCWQGWGSGSGDPC